MPEFQFISPPDKATVSQTVLISGKVEEAKSVEFYLRLPTAVTPTYIGKAILEEGGVWQYKWDTGSTPNNSYILNALITNQYGSYLSSFSVNITVKNEIERDVVKEEKTKKQIEEEREIVAEKTETEKKEAKEKAAQEIIQKVPQTAEKEVRKIIEKFTPETKVETIEKIIQVVEPEKMEEAKKEIKEHLKKLEEKIEEKEKIKAEKEEEIISKDSDGDGIPDYQEIVAYKTNPFAADTDGDGYIDGVEITNGYDPLNPSPAAKIIFEDPKKFEEERPEVAKEITKPEILKVEKVELVPLAVKIEISPTPTPAKEIPPKKATPEATPAPPPSGIKLTGKALPNSFITLYIYSLPTIITVKTDEFGNWVYILDKPLEEGRHEVYVIINDNTGKIVAKSETFAFVKTATAVAAVFAAVPEISPAETIARNYTILIFGFITLFIGIALSIIGLVTKKRG